MLERCGQVRDAVVLAFVAVGGGAKVLRFGRAASKVLNRSWLPRVSADVRPAGHR